MSLRRQTSGSVLCTSCGVLVGVQDDTCYNCGRHNPGLWGFAPFLRSLGRDLGFVPFVIGTCAIVYALTLVFSRGAIGGGGLFSLLSPSAHALIIFGASGAVPVFRADRWWTVLSASFLHGGALHILFNMMWIRQLAPATAELYGAGRSVIIYTVAGVAGFALSSFAGAFIPAIPIIPGMLYLAGSQVSVGASAAIFGLLGALFHYGQRTGSSHVHSQAKSYALLLFFMGLAMPGVDNYAHAGGFGGGYLAALMLDPLKPERVDHVLVAVGCIAVSVAAIVWSVLSVMLI